MGEKSLVLLQTAVLSVMGNNQRIVGVKALFDSCSQQTYIAQRLTKILNLKPLRDISMLVKTFGSEAKNIDAKEYEINLRCSNGEIVPVRAVAVPSVCEKIGGQIVQKAIKVHPFIKTLKLADDGSCPDARVELLVGVDVYWKLVSG